MSTSSLIHANTHRVKEGARVLEDIARFILKDETLFIKIRNLRHALKAVPPNYLREEDLGSTFKENNVRKNLLQIVKANALRIQEALRVLEEFSFEAEVKEKCKYLRFTAYGIYQGIYQCTLQFTKQDKLKGLYLVIDPDVLQLDLRYMADVINESDVNIVQFRKKLANKNALLHDALSFKEMLDPQKLFIINDALDVALDISDGVHLGQDDYPITRMRDFLPDTFVWGVSCHTFQEAEIAYKAGATYLSVGCLFETQSKKDVTPTSLSVFAKIKNAIPLPICAIGGINSKNLKSLTPYKPDMIALITAVWRASHPLKMIKEIQQQILSL